MTVYSFYLTPQFQVEASITDRPDSVLIETIDCDTEDMLFIIGRMQKAAYAALSLAQQEQAEEQITAYVVDKEIN
jgi:hypothetical protein